MILHLSRLGIAAAFFACTAAAAQKSSYDFYPEFRNTILPQLRNEDPGASREQLIDRYLAKLRASAVAEPEIARRAELLRVNFTRLENDYWNRFYLNGNSNFNRSPNDFLVKSVRGMRPGVALDYAMGEGRNAIYLASHGWRVSGFDPADAAIQLAQDRAKELGITLDTAAVSDAEYDFGKDRFDLIVFSWSMPQVPIEKVLASLKPGGSVIMECAADYAGRNEMLHLFDSLQITQYEIVRARADFYDRVETDVLRLIAVKPE